MKKFIFLFLAIFLILPVVSAIEFNVNGNYSQGETIIAVASGNFVTSITKSNAFFYEGHVRIPIEYDVAKMNNDYYIYASLVGKSQGNYSISIENVKYMKGNVVSEDNIVRNFSITNETAAFSIKPGFVSATGDFYIEAQNLLDNKITVAIDTASNNTGRDILITDSGSKTSSLSLNSGEIKKINFKLGTGNASLEQISLKSGNISYSVPVSVPEYSPYVPSYVVSLEPSSLVSSIPTNIAAKRTIFIYNTGDKEVKNITLSLSDEISPFVNLSKYYIDRIAPNDNLAIELSIFSAGETEVEGTLKADVNGEKMLYSSIALKFLNDYIPTNETEASSEKTCAQLQGAVCTGEQVCSVESVYAKDNVCCLGTCSKPGSSGGSSAGKIIAIIIAVIIVGGLAWFYFKKFKKAKKPVNLLDIAKGKKD
jgi:hypothetical protein